MAKHISIEGRRQASTLQPGYLLSWTELQEALARKPKISLEKKFFASIEEATCWAIARRTREYYLKRARDPPPIYPLAEGMVRAEEPENWFVVAAGLKISAYMLGPPQREGALFENWFRDASDSSYRILISTTSQLFRGNRLPYYELEPYAKERYPVFKFLPRHVSAQERHKGKPFLRDFNNAAFFGVFAVEELLKDSGHVYYQSDGLPL